MASSTGGNGNGTWNGQSNGAYQAPGQQTQRPPPQRYGPMTNRYIYDTTGIAERLSGYPPAQPPMTEKERRRLMRREAERLARIIDGNGGN